MSRKKEKRKLGSGAWTIYKSPNKAQKPHTVHFFPIQVTLPAPTFGSEATISPPQGTGSGPAGETQSPGTRNGQALSSRTSPSRPRKGAWS